MGAWIRGIAHVKVPVSDVEGSARPYGRLLGLGSYASSSSATSWRGRPRGPGGGVRRLATGPGFCAGQPDLAGFDVVAFDVGGREDLAEFVARCQRLGVDGGGIQERGPDGAAVDVVDLDGVVLRFVSPGGAGAAEFLGLRFSADGSVTAYDSPLLR